MNVGAVTLAAFVMAEFATNAPVPACSSATVCGLELAVFVTQIERSVVSPAPM